MLLELCEIPSPIGTIRVAVRERRVTALAFADGWARVERGLTRRFGSVEYRPGPGATEVAKHVCAYLGGDLGALADVPIDLGGTPFQRKVWTALRRIAPGATTSYRALARTVGAPAAVRAVGAANGANPIGLIVPCHRVIGSDGSLTGYAGGIERKRWLLAHEGVGEADDRRDLRATEGEQRTTRKAAREVES